MTKPHTPETKESIRLQTILVIALVCMWTWVVVGASVGAANGRHGDFADFYNAGVAVSIGDSPYLTRDDQHIPPYSFGGGGYIYPVFFALIMWGLALLPLNTAAVVWIVGNGLLLIGICWLVIDEIRRRTGLVTMREQALAATAIGFVVLIDKFKSEFHMGQTDVLLILCTVLALRYMGKHPARVGAALAFAITVKYTALIFLPYLLIRRMWREAMWTVTFVFALNLLPAIVYGWNRNLELLVVALGGLARMVGIAHGTEVSNVSKLTWDSSISIPSAMGRLAEITGTGSIAIISLTAAAALACLGLAQWQYRKAGTRLIARTSPDPRGIEPGLVLIEWFAIMVASQVFSPQTSARHLVQTLPVTILAGALILYAPKNIWRVPLLIFLVVMTLGINLPPASWGDGIPLQWWRSVSGSSWVMLTMLFAIIPVMLATLLSNADSQDSTQ